MRIRVDHRTTYTYDTPVLSLIQILRLTPRDHDAQSVHRWQIELNVDCKLKASEDAFGNVTHTLTLPGPLSTLLIAVEGEVETRDSHGLVSGTRERFPPRFYLRTTPLTEADAELAAFAHDVAGRGDSLDRLHGLLGAVHQQISPEPGASRPPRTAPQLFGFETGTGQDFAHTFIACARSLGIPARYVAGHIVRSDALSPQEPGHAWAEAYVDGFGWVGFDAVNRICVTDAYVRVSVGLDCLGALPVRETASNAAVRHSVAMTLGQTKGQYQN